jgi:hypothetical protein
MAFSLAWDPLHFTQEQGYTEAAEEVIKYAITLTGNMSQAQVMPCGQYLSQVWPSSGSVVLQMVQDALREPGVIVQGKALVLPCFLLVDAYAYLVQPTSAMERRFKA